MTETNITEQFFKVFGVEPTKLCFNGDCAVKDEIGYDKNICNNKCVYIDRQYPKITADVLLRLICILSGCCNCTLDIKAKNVEDLKIGVLQQAIDRVGYALNKDKYKHQVRSLFEEVEE